MLYIYGLERRHIMRLLWHSEASAKNGISIGDLGKIESHDSLIGYLIDWSCETIVVQLWCTTNYLMAWLQTTNNLLYINDRTSMFRTTNDGTQCWIGHVCALRLSQLQHRVRTRCKTLYVCTHTYLLVLFIYKCMHSCIHTCVSVCSYVCIIFYTGYVI